AADGAEGAVVDLPERERAQRDDAGLDGGGDGDETGPVVAAGAGLAVLAVLAVLVGGGGWLLAVLAVPVGGGGWLLAVLAVLVRGGRWLLAVLPVLPVLPGRPRCLPSVLLRRCGLRPGRSGGPGLPAVLPVRGGAGLPVGRRHLGMLVVVARAWLLAHRTPPLVVRGHRPMHSGGDRPLAVDEWRTPEAPRTVRR